MEHSKEINELAAALAKAQARLRTVQTDAANPYFASRYATLAACLEEIKEPFEENGLSVVQAPTHHHPSGVTVTTMLMHTSGQWIKEMLKVEPLEKRKQADGTMALEPNPTPQGLGSAITYARRYMLAAMCGLAQADDDGNEASAPEPKKPPAKKKPAGPKKITQAQIQLVYKQCKRLLPKGDGSGNATDVFWDKVVFAIKDKPVDDYTQEAARDMLKALKELKADQHDKWPKWWKDAIQKAGDL